MVSDLKNNRQEKVSGLYATIFNGRNSIRKIRMLSNRKQMRNKFFFVNNFPSFNKYIFFFFYINKSFKPIKLLFFKYVKYEWQFIF